MIPTPKASEDKHLTCIFHQSPQTPFVVDRGGQLLMAPPVFKSIPHACCGMSRPLLRLCHVTDFGQQNVSRHEACQMAWV